jgi:hypothetical protein
MANHYATDDDISHHYSTDDEIKKIQRYKKKDNERRGNDMEGDKVYLHFIDCSVDKHIRIPLAIELYDIGEVWTEDMSCIIPGYNTVLKYYTLKVSYRDKKTKTTEIKEVKFQCIRWHVLCVMCELMKIVNSLNIGKIKYKIKGEKKNKSKPDNKNTHRLTIKISSEFDYLEFDPSIMRDLFRGGIDLPLNHLFTNKDKIDILYVGSTVNTYKLQCSQLELAGFPNYHSLCQLKIVPTFTDGNSELPTKIAQYAFLPESSRRSFDAVPTNNLTELTLYKTYEPVDFTSTPATIHLSTFKCLPASLTYRVVNDLNIVTILRNNIYFELNRHHEYFIHAVGIEFISTNIINEGEFIVRLDWYPSEPPKYPEYMEQAYCNTDKRDCFSVNLFTKHIQCGENRDWNNILRNDIIGLNLNDIGELHKNVTMFGYGLCLTIETLTGYTFIPQQAVVTFTINVFEKRY